MARNLCVYSIVLIVFALSCGGEIPGETFLPIKAHGIFAELGPEESTISCRDTITVDMGRREAGRFRFFLNKSLEVEAVRERGRSIPFSAVTEFKPGDYLEEAEEGDREFYANAALLILEIPSAPGDVPEDGPRTFVVEYSGVIYDSLKVAAYSRGAEAEQTTGLIDTAGVFLGPPSHWYPAVPDSMARFGVTAVTPKGYETVTQGRLVSRESHEGTVKTVWRGAAPSDGAYLIAGPYDVRTLKHEGVELATYFYRSEADLSEQYLSACSRYIGMYNELLGPYPYSKFAVVENFFPTGYGMPSYTLLGRRVLRLPFIVHTSLGHEIAHNWWGNGVLVDPDDGNWCEGLTTYCADYRYKHLKGHEDAREYRRDINRDFTVYVTLENDMPLTEFTERTTRATRAIGYGKCAMVFHMLNRVMGEERFFETLRTLVSKYMFKQMGWEEIEAEFSSAHGEDLGWFFSQWVRGTGAPTLEITDAAATDEWTEYILSVRLEQQGGPFRMSVPLEVRTEGRSLWKTVEMSESVTEARFRCRRRPVSVRVDPGHDLMRRMEAEEIAPTLSLVLGDDETLVVTPGGAEDEAGAAYEAFASRLTRTGEARLLRDSQLADSLIATHSLFILGGAGENSALDSFDGEWPTAVFFKPGAFKIQGETYSSPGHCAFFVGRNPSNPQKTVVVFGGLSFEAIKACSRKLIHYGKYGYVVFDEGTAVDKGTWEVRDYPEMNVRLVR